MQVQEVRFLVSERGWPIDRIVVIDQTPLDARSGSKVDYASLARKLVANPQLRPG
jgi:hypothetical protein